MSDSTDFHFTDYQPYDFANRRLRCSQGGH